MMAPALCGCAATAGIETLATRKDLIAPAAVAIGGIVLVGLVAAWLLSGEALGIETGSVVSDTD
jgi:hypothetical protein